MKHLSTLLKWLKWLKAPPWGWQSFGIFISALPIVLALGVFLSAQRRETSVQDPTRRYCQTFVNDQQTPFAMTDAIEQELAGKEGASREEVRQLLGEPFCVLPKLSLRQGTIAEREVYLIEDERRDRLVVAYEDERYIGFGLESRQQMEEHWGMSAGASDAPLSNFLEIELKQTWGIQVGQFIEGHPVVSGLGDVSVRMQGNLVAPFDAIVADEFVLVAEGSLLRSPDGCIVVSSPLTPAYLVRLCGLRQYQSGQVHQGEILGSTNGYVHLALFSFRRDEQGNRRWLYVAPSQELVESFLPQ